MLGDLDDEARAVELGEQWAQQGRKQRFRRQVHTEQARQVSPSQGVERALGTGQFQVDSEVDGGSVSEPSVGRRWGVEPAQSFHGDGRSLSDVDDRLQRQMPAVAGNGVDDPLAPVASAAAEQATTGR